jgi:hypothetical protein
MGMNIQEYRKLGEALERLKGILMLAVGDDLDIVFAAARLTYDRYQECGECEGTGDQVESVPVGHFVHRPCPSCGGLGLQPNQARFKAAAKAVAEAYEGTMFPQSRDMFLAGVRAFDKEPT